MKSVFESMGGTYTQAGDYFVPDIALPKTGNRKIGKYGRMRHRYLKEHRPVICSTMILDGTLWDHLAEVDIACNTQYSPFTMAEARKNVSQLLDEHEEESCSIRDRLRNHQQEQTALLKNKKDRDR